MLKPPTIQNLLFHIPKQHSLCVCLFVDQAPIPWKMDEDHQFIDRLLQIVNFNSFFLTCQKVTHNVSLLSTTIHPSLVFEQRPKPPLANDVAGLYYKQLSWVHENLVWKSLPQPVDKDDCRISLREKQLLYLAVYLKMGGTPKSSIYSLIFHYKPSN